MTTKPTSKHGRKAASYFSSIEQTYGKPIDHWLTLARTRTNDKHMDVVNWLKSEQGLGHGHANAVVAHVRAEAE